MRLAPLLTAITVLVSLYLLIMERPLLLALAGASPAEAVEAPADAPLESTGDAPGEGATPERRVGVVVQRVEERELESAVVLRGRTAAARQVEVRSETSGLVASDPLPRGSAVQAGDVMCQLDPGTRRAQLVEAEARLAEAQINFEAASRLSEDGFAAQTRVAAADAARRGAEAAVEAARTELGRLEIRAPFDGLLEADTAERGSLMSQGALCGTVMRLDPILLVAFAAEAQIDQLELGAAAGARLANGTEVMGRVTFLARSADPATRTFRVEVTVPNPDLAIRDGLSADLLVAATSTRGHLVPGSALTLDDGGQLGLRLIDEGSRTFFAPVRVLRDTAEGFWVAGLPETADVVVVGHEYVTDGVQVRAVRRGEGD